MSHSTTRFAWWSLAAVCFFWGTTYLGIRIALEGLPPTVLVSSRFLLSGALILLFAWVRGWQMPRGMALARPIGTGVLMLGVGTYCLALAETIIPSGIAALFITVSPFWMVAAEAIIPGGARVQPKALIGMLLGFTGAILLVGPDALQSGFSGTMVRGFAILQISCLGWAVGSILQRRRPEGTNPILVGGIQQFSVGLIFLLISIFNGNLEVHITPRVAGAVLYLALFGSIVAYSAYLYSLQHLPVAVVSSTPI